MPANQKPSKRKRGRPVEYPMPEPITDTLENVLKALGNLPAKETRGVGLPQEGREKVVPQPAQSRGKWSLCDVIPKS